jgi:aryl-alcohol dehydrogenase-like predicted oxidoreductase
MQSNKILLPKNPVDVPTPWLWLGTWSMGGEGFGQHDERESLKVLHSAVETGIRHFDTAGFYAHGRSEKLLQQTIIPDRQKFFISSKGGLVWNGRSVEHRASPGELKSQLYESLERLKTDYLDLYQLHWPDPKVPVPESIAALKDLQKSGLIRYWGVSNLSERDIYHYLIKEDNIPHQVHFNPVHRNFNVLHAGEKECINCIISPLEQGLLVRGQSLSGQEGIGKKDIRSRNPYFSDLKVLVWRKRLNELMVQSPLSKVSLILMWICAQPHVHAIIPGPRKPVQIDEILRFKSEVIEYDMLALADDTNIISRRKAAEIIPDDLWKCLSKGP